MTYMTQNTNPAFKLLIVGRRRAGQTLAEHQHHILHIHGSMVLKLIASNPEHAPRRYAQNRVVDGTWRQAGPADDTFSLTRDFITEVWFDNPAQAGAALSHPSYKDNLQPDEDRFVDQASVAKLAVRERIVGAPKDKLGACKLFVFSSKAASASSADFSTAWQKLGDALASCEAAALFQQHIQNHVMAKPGESTVVDGVDEFWTEDLAAATALAKAVKSSMTEPLLAQGLLAPGLDFILMAQESMLFAGTPAQVEAKN